MSNRKFITYLIMGWTFCLAPAILIGCCGEPEVQHVDDTRFEMSVKMVDGSWSEVAWNLPSTSEFYIRGVDGTYYLSCTRWEDDHGIRLKTAVIDYKVLKKTRILDTTATRINLEHKTLTPESMR